MLMSLHYVRMRYVSLETAVGLTSIFGIHSTTPANAVVSGLERDTSQHRYVCAGECRQANVTSGNAHAGEYDTSTHPLEEREKPSNKRDKSSRILDSTIKETRDALAHSILSRDRCTGLASKAMTASRLELGGINCLVKSCVSCDVIGLALQDLPRTRQRRRGSGYRNRNYTLVGLGAVDYRTDQHAFVALRRCVSGDGLRD